MNKSVLNIVFITTLMAVTQQGSASDVTIPNSFTAGTPAVAAQVNDNFSVVESAVHDNYTRITTLEGVNAATRLTALETNADNPDISGNITLVPSTTSAGNVYKGTAPFLHNYGIQNTFLGEYAGNFSMTGTDNIAIGAYAFVYNSTGSANTAIGIQALYNNTTGGSNTASGEGAMRANLSGSENTATGAGSLSHNTNGMANTANGHSALNGNTTGTRNTAIGAYSLNSNTSGIYNTAIGSSSLTANTTGQRNIALGYHSGIYLTTGNYNIDIGNFGVAGEGNTIRIGSSGNQSRTFIAGIRGVTTDSANAIAVMIDSNGQLGTVSSSRRVKDHITDMGDASKVLMQLRPVTFYYKSDPNPQGRALQYGLVAEEVAEVAPQLVARSKNGEIETVYYQHLAPMLLNEYQQQQRMMKAQAREIAVLRQQAARVVSLEEEVARMQAVLADLQRSQKVAAAGQP